VFSNSFFTGISVLCVMLWSCNSYSALQWLHHKLPLCHVHRPVYVIELYNFAVLFAKIRHRYKSFAVWFVEDNIIKKVVYTCQFWIICTLDPYGSDCLHILKILMTITDNYGPEESWSIAVAKYKNSFVQRFTDLCIFKEIFFSMSMLVTVFSSNFFCLRM